MPGRRFAQRLAGLTDAALCRMAWAPGHRAPTAREALAPTPVPPMPDDPAAALALCGAEDVAWDGGVPVAASLSGRAFVSLGVRLFHVAPLRAVRLVAVDPVICELPGCPTLARLERLDLSGCWLGPDAVRALADSPHVAGLRELDLSANGLDDAAAAALAGSPQLGNLRVLRFDRNPGVTDVGRRRLRERFATTE